MYMRTAKPNRIITITISYSYFTTSSTHHNILLHSTTCGLTPGHSCSLPGMYQWMSENPAGQHYHFNSLISVTLVHSLPMDNSDWSIGNTISSSNTSWPYKSVQKFSYSQQCSVGVCSSYLILYTTHICTSCVRNNICNCKLECICWKFQLQTTTLQ